MRAGILTEQIEIKRPIIETNEYGEKNKVYSVKQVTRAEVKNIKCDREVINEEIVYTYTKTFVVRMYVDVQEEDLIVWKGKEYLVQNIDKNKSMQNITITTQVVNE